VAFYVPTLTGMEENIYPVSFPAPSVKNAAQVHNCRELLEYITLDSRGPIDIYVEDFNVVGPILCETLASVVVENSSISFRGAGGLIFGLPVILNNAVLFVEEGVDVVFINQFHSKDSQISIAENSVVKMMFMPKEGDGYHNYLDKNVMLWPEEEKKISFSGVTMIGGGDLEFLSELNLRSSGFTIKNGNVFFQREFGASAITGEGDLTVLSLGYASFGIESVLNGEGNISIFGRAEISDIAKVVSERDVVVHQGGKLIVDGTWKPLGKVSYL